MALDAATEQEEREDFAQSHLLQLLVDIKFLIAALDVTSPLSPLQSCPEALELFEALPWSIKKAIEVLLNGGSSIEGLKKIATEGQKKLLPKHSDKLE